jgi:MFS family permease
MYRWMRSQFMPRNTPASSHTIPPTPLWAVVAVTFLASIGTGVVWNGVPFIAKHDYEFSETTTLALYLVLGAMYVVGAISTGRVLRMMDRWLGPRSALMIILSLEAIVCVSLYITRETWMLWVVACSISVLSSWLWPIIESYLTAGRHGGNMRNAIGWWNLSWTGAVAIALVLMMPVMKKDPAMIEVGERAIALEPRMAIVILGALHAVALLPLMWFGRRPGAHDESLHLESIQREYPLLLRAARMLLPLSYVLNSAMSPLLPFLFERVHLTQDWQTTAASTWMWVRIIAMAVMWQVGFWHGRWGTLLLGGLAMTMGFGIAVTGISLPMMIAGLAIFGIGMGVVYYAALYYAMAVGRAKVDAGGTHEALIGLGYTVGPATGLIGVSASSAARDAGLHLWDGVPIVAVVWLLVAICAYGVIKPYLAARRVRSGRD